ncbi:MAG: hypothetical protein ACO1NK_03705 [Sediminibacterium sp.]
MANNSNGENLVVVMARMVATVLQAPIHDLLMEDIPYHQQIL